MSEEPILIGPLKWKPKLTSIPFKVPEPYTCGCAQCKVWFMTTGELREHFRTKHGAYKP